VEAIPPEEKSAETEAVTAPEPEEPEAGASVIWVRRALKPGVRELARLLAVTACRKSMARSADREVEIPDNTIEISADF
jgi:hypothetical protein